MVGALDVLPDTDRGRAQGRPGADPDRTVGVEVNMAVGYGGRREIADAVRSLLHEHAAAGRTHRGTGRDPRRRAHRRAPLHPRPARPGPGHPDQRRAAALRFPAVAVGALGVLLPRRQLAGFPPHRLPAGAALVRQPPAPLRRLTPCRGRIRPVGESGRRSRNSATAAGELQREVGRAGHLGAGLRVGHRDAHAEERRVDRLAGPQRVERLDVATCRPRNTRRSRPSWTPSVITMPLSWSTGGLSSTTIRPAWIRRPSRSACS